MSLADPPKHGIHRRALLAVLLLVACDDGPSPGETQARGPGDDPASAGSAGEAGTSASAGTSAFAGNGGSGAAPNEPASTCLPPPASFDPTLASCVYLSSPGMVARGCLAATDPALADQFDQACTISTIAGPYCFEQQGYASCCYTVQYGICDGRPLLVRGVPLVAAIVRQAW
jgi:hypothetical protein